MARHTVNVISVSILFLMSIVCGQSQWVQTNAPGGLKINALLVTDNSLFAATNEGVYLCDKNTFTLNKISSIYSKGYSFLKVGDTIFTGANHGQAYVSVNNGVFWKHTIIDTGLFSSEIHAFAKSGNSLFAAVSSTESVVGSIYYTSDFGESWNKALPINVNVHAFAVKEDTLFAGTDNGVFVSRNKGASWGLSTTLSQQKVMTLAINGNTVFAGTYERSGSGVFRSTNNGESWSLADTGLPHSTVGALTVIRDTIYACMSGMGLFFSIDNGSLWKPLCTDQICLYVTSFAADDNTIYAGTEFDGVIYSRDGGVSWTTLSVGTKNTGVKSLNIYGNTFYAGTELGLLYSSTTSGASWSAFKSRVPGPVKALVVDGSGILSTAGKCICHSADNGISWDTVVSVDQLTYALSVIDSNMFIGTYDGLIHTRDNGKSWARNNLKADKVYALAADNNTVFAGTGDSGVYISTNMGDSWTAANNGLTKKNITSLAVKGNNVFAGIFGRGVFFSNNKGASWSSISTGLADTYVNALMIKGDTVFAGTSSKGVWHRSISLITDVIPRKQKKALLPSKLQIYNRHSSHGDVMLIYRLESRCAIQASLHTVSGQAVVLLADGEKMPGTHSIRIRKGSVTAGLYVCRFVAGSVPENIKIIMNK